MTVRSWLVFCTTMVFLLSVGICLAGGVKANDCHNLKRPQKVSCLKSVLENDPCNREAVWQLVYSYRDSDEVDQVMAFLEHLSELDPKIARPHKLRALLLKYHFHNDVAAEEQMQIARSLLPCPDEEGGVLPPTRENAEKIWERALYRREKGDYAGAVEDIETYLILVGRPDNPGVFKNLALCKAAMGDIQGAVDAHTRELELFPHMAIVELPARAALKRKLGDIAGAEEDLAAAKHLEAKKVQGDLSRVDKRVAEHPEAVYWRVERSRLRTLVRDFRGAIADCEKVIELKPGSPSGYLCRAKVRGAIGDAAGAKADREHSRELIRAKRKERRATPGDGG